MIISTLWLEEVGIEFVHFHGPTKEENFSAKFRVWRWTAGQCCLRLREYWMIYRGSGFLGVVWFSSPPPLPSVSSTGDTNEDNLFTGEGGGRNEIGRRRESLVLYKSFNTISVPPSLPRWLGFIFNFHEPPLQFEFACLMGFSFLTLRQECLFQNFISRCYFNILLIFYIYKFVERISIILQVWGEIGQNWAKNRKKYLFFIVFFHRLWTP